jgi:hypothetical protein
MAYINKLSGEMLFDDSSRPIKGVYGDAVLINMNDIDFSSTVISGASVTTLTLKAGSTGYKLSWYKELASGSASFTPNMEDIDGFSQSFLARLATTSADNAERAKELSQGRFVVVYQTRFGGTDNADKIKVLGLDTGLELSEMTQNTNENSGSILFTLSTKEGVYEEHPFRVYLNTDFETSLADLESAFTAVV